MISFAVLNIDLALCTRRTKRESNESPYVNYSLRKWQMTLPIYTRPRKQNVQRLYFSWVHVNVMDQGQQAEFETGVSACVKSDCDFRRSRKEQRLA